MLSSYHNKGELPKHVHVWWHGRKHQCPWRHHGKQPPMSYLIDFCRLYFGDGHLIRRKDRYEWVTDS